jgi:hypothetical protein
MQTPETKPVFAKVDPEKFVAIARKLGLTIVRQPSQWKITGTDGSMRFYIPGQKLVHKVELSGWKHDRAVEWARHYPGKKSPSPKITHIIDFLQDEKSILRDFYLIAKSLPVAIPEEAPASETASEPVPEETGHLLAASS